MPCFLNSCLFSQTVGRRRILPVFRPSCDRPWRVVALLLHSGDVGPQVLSRISIQVGRCEDGARRWDARGSGGRSAGKIVWRAAELCVGDTRGILNRHPSHRLRRDRALWAPSGADLLRWHGSHRDERVSTRITCISRGQLPVWTSTRTSAPPHMFHHSIWKWRFRELVPAP